MGEELESRAAAACREVSISVALAAVMPGLGALTGLVVMPLVEPEADLKLLPALGFLAVSCGLLFLARAVRQQKMWSFLAVQATFSAVALGGLALLWIEDDVDKVGIMVAVVLPMLFVGYAARARTAVQAAQAARRTAGSGPSAPLPPPSL